MVRTWVAQIRNLYREQEYRACYEKAPAFRQKKADRIGTLQGRAQSIGVWTLWEQVRAKYQFPDGATVNFSHSGDYVMCAVQTEGSGSAVGCDIEKIKEFRGKLAEHFFCKEEKEALRKARTEEEAAKMFYRFWVLKESFMKATRKGMAMPLDGFCVQLGEPSILVRQPEEFPENYYYREYKIPGQDYCLAVCSTDCEIEEKLHLWIL